MWFSRQALALRYRDGFVPSFIALTYVLLGYSSGLFLLSQGNIALWLLGTLLLAHALTIAAYLIHDLTHNALFARPETNERLGLLLAWLTGACYSNYRELRQSHMRHHVQRMDVVAVDYKAWLKKHPVLRRTVEILEWCYLPAVDLMMHGLVIVAPFVFPGHAHRRWYVLKTLLIRICLFTILFLTSPWIRGTYAYFATGLWPITAAHSCHRTGFDEAPVVGTRAQWVAHDGHYDSRSSAPVSSTRRSAPRG